ncbi:hypothetical protein [Aphanizomenon flos-aquae]|uniref:hypothetical protein n=2 Tax=Aphanizomenonaceae TaxID=1892259 RepID=UPI000487BFE9|nr:hypothetical protein [Aphanizomenon flos-aquae]
MQVLINELSIIGQFDNKYSAEVKMEIVKDIIWNIFKDFYQDDKYILNPINHIKIHSSFLDCKLCSDFTISDWLKEQYKHKTKISVILAGIKRNRDLYIDNILNRKLQYWECEFNLKDCCESSLAGAAYLEGRLISLQDAPEFKSEDIEVYFGIEEEPLKKKNIHNLTTIEQARKLRPRYKFHTKHDPERLWKTPSDEASPMNLTPEKAQKILDKAVIHDLTDGTQYYGYYQDKFYEFQPGGEGDGTGKFDLDGYPLYHGYIIEENELKEKASNIWSKLRNLIKNEG